MAALCFIASAAACLFQTAGKRLVQFSAERLRICGKIVYNM